MLGGRDAGRPGCWEAGMLGGRDAGRPGCWKAGMLEGRKAKPEGLVLPGKRKVYRCSISKRKAFAKKSTFNKF